MCGIVGYVGHRNCPEILIEGLRRLEYRGYDSAGLAVHDGTRIERRRAEGKLARLEALQAAEPVRGTLGVGHTRWATHGRPSERNAHPHRVGDVVVVHNGIIENHMELRVELLAEGAVFESETDTEIVAHLVARERASGLSLYDALRATLARLRGSWALVVLDEREPRSFVVARNQSPLVLGLGEGENFAASDVPAILSHTRSVIFLEDGDTAVIAPDAVSVRGSDGAPVERAVRRITWDPIAAEKQGFKHFMLKEIHEQPARVVDTLRGRISLERGLVELPEFGLGRAEIADIDRIVITACGTSLHAGIVGKYAIERLARVPVDVEMASEFRNRKPVLTPRTLVLAVTQSGETADTLAAIREARAAGARTACICNVMESSITRACHATLYTQAGPEIGVASTKAFTTQLAAFYLLAIWLGQERGILGEAERGRLLLALRHAPSAMEAALDLESQIRSLARDFTDTASCLYLGRGPEYAIALEGALKIKEISYIHAEGYAAGEMKHGPIALIDDHLPVVVLAPRNAWYEKTLSNLQEVRARGGHVIAITSGDPSEVSPLARHVLVVPDVDELFQPLVTVLPLQMLAYSVADMKGTDVDQPRNLAKSVTVE